MADMTMKELVKEVAKMYVLKIHFWIHKLT